MLKVNSISKKYTKGHDTFRALAGVSLEVSKGDFVAVIGPSGSGKSTLLNAIGGLVHPDEGTVYYNGKDIYASGRRQLDKHRKKNVGFVFQQFHLIPYLTVYENILMACTEKKQQENVAGYLEQCSLSEQKNKYPSELSVGEKQRTAFIRAIISEPELLLADEPTGNLDPENSTSLLRLITDFNKKRGTVILVSHDRHATEYSNKVLTLDKGMIASQL